MVLGYSIVIWEPEGSYQYSKMFRWEPNGCYRCTMYMVIASFWFSTEHLWMVIAPFWFSTEHLWTVIAPFWNSSEFIGYKPEIMQASGSGMEPDTYIIIVNNCCEYRSSDCQQKVLFWTSFHADELLYKILFDVLRWFWCSNLKEELKKSIMSLIFKCKQQNVIFSK